MMMMATAETLHVHACHACLRVLQAPTVWEFCVHLLLCVVIFDAAYYAWHKTHHMCVRARKEDEDEEEEKAAEVAVVVKNKRRSLQEGC